MRGTLLLLLGRLGTFLGAHSDDLFLHATIIFESHAVRAGTLASTTTSIILPLLNLVLLLARVLLLRLLLDLLDILLKYAHVDKLSGDDNI